MRPRREITRVGRDIWGPPAHPSQAPRSFAGGIETEVRTYWRIFRRHLGLIFWIASAVAGAGLAYTLLQEPVYRATALIGIRGGGDSPSVEQLFADQEPTTEYLRTRFGLMTSATLANRVIDELRLDTLEVFDPEGEASRRELVDAFLETLVVDPVEESRLVMINFDASSPDLAAAIVNQVVDSYGQLRVDSHRDAARRVAEQVDSVETRLATAEAELRTFAAEHDLPFLVEEDLSAQISTRLVNLRERLAEAEATRYENESLYEVVVREGRRDLVDDESLQTLQLRLADLRSEYARITATFQESYPAAAELSRQIEHVEALVEEERGRLARRVESDYQLAMQQEAMLTDAIDAEAELSNELGPANGDYHVLRQAVLANRNLYSTLLERRRQAEIVAAIGPTDLEVIDRATPPLEPYRPVFAMNVGLALMLGLVLGVGAAFGRELFDDTVETAEDFPVSDDVPVLALIPAVGTNDKTGSVFKLPAAQRMLPGRKGGGRGGGEKGWHRIDRVHPTGRALADSFGALRTSILFRDQDELLPRTILVSSCRAGEGKTTVSVNFAMSLSQLGHRVLLIDADLRRPSVHRAFGIPSRPGMVDCLQSGMPWQDAVQHSVARGLAVLTSGGATSRAGDLLAGAGLEALLREVEAEYDYVVVDAPALFINAADARVLSQLVDGVIVVVRSRFTPRALVDRIPRAAPNVIGVVVNDLRKDSLPAYYAEYFAEYGENRPDESANGNGRKRPSNRPDRYASGSKTKT